MAKTFILFIYLILFLFLYFFFAEQTPKHVRIVESEGKREHPIGVRLAKDDDEIGGRDSIQHESENATRVAAACHQRRAQRLKL